MVYPPLQKKILQQTTDDKKAVYNTTYEILVALPRCLRPLPLPSEEICWNLTGELSVHLSDYPTPTGNS